MDISDDYRDIGDIFIKGTDQGPKPSPLIALTVVSPV